MHRGGAGPSAVFSPDGRHPRRRSCARRHRREPGLVRIGTDGRRDVAREIEFGGGGDAFDRSGARIVTFDEIVETWDVRTGARIREELSAARRASGTSRSVPTGSRVATAYRNYSIVLLDTGTGDQVVLPQRIGMGVSFSPDGQRLASVGIGLAGDSIRIWAPRHRGPARSPRAEVTRSLTDEESGSSCTSNGARD